MLIRHVTAGAISPAPRTTASYRVGDPLTWGQVNQYGPVKPSVTVKDLCVRSKQTNKINSKFTPKASEVIWPHSGVTLESFPPGSVLSTRKVPLALQALLCPPQWNDDCTEQFHSDQDYCMLQTVAFLLCAESFLLLQKPGGLIMSKSLCFPTIIPQQISGKLVCMILHCVRMLDF